jgi:phosphatidylserine/phosphatidylglycerophosphate/cardiolipin synthase-like enzyme
MSITAPAEFIQALHAHNTEPVVFCTHLIHTAAVNGGTVTAEQTADEFDIHTEAAVHLFDCASQFGLVKYPTPKANQVDVSRSTVTEFIHFLTYFQQYTTSTELELLAENGVHDIEFTASVPSEFENYSADLMAQLIQFVRNAKSELLVVTPFFTQFGVDTFVDHLAQATDRGVHVTILTRDVTEDGENSEYIQQIHDKVTESGISRNLSILEYTSEHGRLHAKALISDDEAAYVGSANFTNYSLKSAIEIGLIVQGSIIEDLIEFFATVQASADTQEVGLSTF